jgi:ribosome-binding protein aMBF1 (putative translation factor)
MTTRTTCALKILAAMVGNDSKAHRPLDNARVNAQVARLVHDARTGAGLTQRQLAARVGTKRSVIARVEDADYEGHSLSMLRRIANAVGNRLEICLTPADRRIARSA